MIINILHYFSENGPEESKVRVLRILALCALKYNFINFLNLDRKQRSVMKCAKQFDELTINEQKAIATLICNLFSDPKTSSYALYFSEWELKTGNGTIDKFTNAQLVVNLALSCLQSHNPSLIHSGAGIVYNISTRQVRVLEKPIEDEAFDFSNDAKLDYEDVSHSDLSEKKGSFVALKAYDNIVIDICSSLWEVITDIDKDLSDEVMTCCLKTLKNFAHMLDIADSEMADELKNISEDRKLNQSNQELITELLAKFSIS